MERKVTREEVKRVLEQEFGKSYLKSKERILNELFSPEFKVGDWVVVLETDEFYFNSEYGVAKPNIITH